MTEIAVRDEPGHVTQFDPTGGRLVAWAQAAAAANQLAKALSKTSFIPAAFQGKEYDATAAIIMGDELGLSPIAALRSLYVVHGTPAMYARTMVALAQGHGHQVWTEKTTDSEVVVCGQRKGTDKVERSVWTIARARQAGYTSNKKYASNPQEMLYAKASAEIARKVAADVLAGVPYSVEDLELEQPAPTSTVTRSTERKTTARRTQPPPVAPDEPPLDDGEASAAGVTEPQIKKLHALFGDFEVEDRDERLRVASMFAGRNLETSKDLTKDEASRVIDRLQQILDQDGNRVENLYWATHDDPEAVADDPTLDEA